MSRDRTAVDAAFAKYVNLAARELEHWLGTTASAAAAGDGNREGEAVLRVLRTPKGDRTDDDAAFMRRVIEHITAERERGPAQDADPAESAWRHGLLNWGHDPLTWSPAPLPAAALASAGRTAPDPRPGDSPRGASPAPPP